MNVFATEKRQSCIKSKLKFFLFGTCGAKKCISLRVTSLWRQNDAIRDEIPHTLNQRNYNFEFMQLCLFSVASTFIVLRLKPPKIWPYMVMWREIWISLITCNSTPFYPIEIGFSPAIMEFYAENYYQTFTIFFLNFLLMPNFDITCHVTIAVTWDDINTNT